MPSRTSRTARPARRLGGRHYCCPRMGHLRTGPILTMDRRPSAVLTRVFPARATPSVPQLCAQLQIGRREREERVRGPLCSEHYWKAEVPGELALQRRVIQLPRIPGRTSPPWQSPSIRLVAAAAACRRARLGRYRRPIRPVGRLSHQPTARSLCQRGSASPATGEMPVGNRSWVRPPLVRRDRARRNMGHRGIQRLNH
jgi:hypothetical protein